MKSKISFYSKEIIRNNLRMYGLLSLFWGIFLFIVYPLIIATGKEVKTVENLSPYLFNSGIMISMVVPLCMGMVFFGFLKSEKATAFYMSLPTSKNAVFFSQYISAAILYIVPLIINTFLLMALHVSYLKEEPIHLLILEWFLVMILLFFINFTISAGMGMITGSSIWHILFLIAYFALPTYFGSGFDFFTEKLIRGFSGNHRFFAWFNQIDILYLSIRESRFEDRLRQDYLIFLLVYLVVVLVLAYILYHRKKMENNKEWISYTFFKYFFIVGFTACMVFLLSVVFSEMIYPDSQGAVYLGAGVGAVLGYIIAAMIAWKTIYLKKAWWGSLLALCITLGVVGAIDLDMFGFERKIPETNRIVSVNINHHGDQWLDMERVKLLNLDEFHHSGTYEFKEKENIDLVRSIHKKILEQENSRAEDQHNIYVRIIYRLDDGSEMIRSYWKAAYSPFKEEYEKLALTDEYMKQEYPILNNENIKNIRRIRVSTDFTSSEESFTDEKMLEFMSVLQEEVRDFVDQKENVPIHKGENHSILLLEQTPIHVIFEKVEVKDQKFNPNSYGEIEWSEKDKYFVNEYRLSFKGKAPKLRKWLLENSRFHTVMKVQEDMIEQMNAYHVDGYTALGIEYKTRWKEYVNLATEDTESNPRKIMEYLKLSGEMMYGATEPVTILDIRLKNGNSFLRVMLKEDYEKLKASIK